MKEIIVRTLLRITTSLLEFLEIDIKFHWKRTIEVHHDEINKQ
jgi:hypothetical protein